MERVDGTLIPLPASRPIKIGLGTVLNLSGQQIFEANCALCHGQHGEGIDGMSYADDVERTHEAMFKIVNTGRHEKFEMFTADPQDFPPVSEMEGKPDFTISGTSLRTLIERTIFAAAKESTRYAIDGLLFNYDGERLKLVATDGRRLAMAHAEVQNCGANKSSAIVPAKAMSLIAHMPAGPDENFDIKLLSNQFLLRSPRVTLSSVLLEGHFPKYEDVIPQDCDRTVRVQAPALLGAVRRSALLTSEESRAIRLHFEKNKVVMTGRAPEQGQSSVELEVVYDAEEMDIGFNPNFLSDVLKILGDSEVQLDLKDANRPGLFRSDDYMYVVMPVNLS
ncbi:MAG: DNA polymerase III subunit beta, partial [Planctomycetes bacterium]|nr:DNA polymerase III subunit beta [Planctomycetota bacterium]